jgi:hypothetical protein
LTRFEAIDKIPLPIYPILHLYRLISSKHSSEDGNQKMLKSVGSIPPTPLGHCAAILDGAAAATAASA